MRHPPTIKNILLDLSEDTSAPLDKLVLWRKLSEEWRGEMSGRERDKMAERSMPHLPMDRLFDFVVYAASTPRGSLARDRWARIALDRLLGVNEWTDRAELLLSVLSL